MLIGEGVEKYHKLMNSDFVDNDNYEDLVLLRGAPPDIVELFEWYKGIREREIREGVKII